MHDQSRCGLMQANRTKRTAAVVILVMNKHALCKARQFCAAPRPEAGPASRCGWHLGSGHARCCMITALPDSGACTVAALNTLHYTARPSPATPPKGARRGGRTPVARQMRNGAQKPTMSSAPGPASMADSATVNTCHCQRDNCAVALTSSGGQMAGVRIQSRCCASG